MLDKKVYRQWETYNYNSLRFLFTKNYLHFLLISQSHHMLIWLALSSNPDIVEQALWCKMEGERGCYIRNTC